MLDVPAEVSPVHFHDAGKLRLALLLGDGLAQFVGQGEGRLILDIHVTPELQGRDALDRVHENRGCGEIVADGELAAGEDGPAGDAEL